jgi:hypothetical protein
MTATAKSLYATVANLGISRAQARRLLPAWWAPEMEKAEDGAAELALLLSRRLSLDAAALLKGRLEPKGAVKSVAYKHSVGVETDTLRAVTFMASSLAQTVSAAMRVPYRPLPSHLTVIREQTRQAGNGTLGFGGLLKLCWSHGIPVIPLKNLPVGMRKMDGAALLVGDRPAIVLAKRKSSKAWLSFILAHEVGHIALGHLRPGSTIIDVSLQESATYSAESSEDKDEAAADDFALSILGGEEAANAINQWPPATSPVELAVEARAAGAVLRLEPGHLILRHAFNHKRWMEAVMALNFLSEDMDPQASLLTALMQHLDLSNIAADLQDLITEVTGWHVSSGAV